MAPSDMRYISIYSVQSYSMHALDHLPFLVTRFGALWNVSVAPFENAFYHFKCTVSGTRNEGKLIVERFLRNIYFYHRSDTEFSSYCKVLGCSKMVKTDDNFFLLYGFGVLVNDRRAFRFVNNDHVFHSVEYSRGDCASFLAYLNDNTFVRIDRIIIRDEKILCLCTILRKVQSVSELLDLASNIKVIAKKHCASFIVEDGGKCCFPGEIFIGHLIVTSFDTFQFATPVLENFDIE